MDERQADTLWAVGVRVVAGLASLAAVTISVRFVVDTVRKSQTWLQEQVREAFKKELK